MLYKKTGFPEDNELVLCTVTAVQRNCVFVNLDEYGNQGMIHISEVSPGRIRNIRDFVREGRKVVCKVLNIHKERGHIDLSLRRVNESQKRKKMSELKLEQKAEKMLELVAEKFKVNVKELHSNIISQISEDYENLNSYFEDIALRNAKMDRLKIDSKLKKELEEIIKQRIKPVEVEVKGNLKLKSYASDGVNIVKESLKNAQDTGKNSLSIKYKGAGQYTMAVKSMDYKNAEKILDNSSKSAISFIEKNKGIGSFARIE